MILRIWFNQTKILEREEIIRCRTTNIKNNKKDSTEKYRTNIRVQYPEQMTEEVVKEEIWSIQNTAKQKEHNDVTKEISNNQLPKETLIGDRQRKGKAEEPKYRGRSVEINRTKQSNYNENKTENRNNEKEQQDIKKVKTA